MPFTVSHIAAVLPFHKPLRRLGLTSAAAIGAMAPDFDLIMPVALKRVHTHSLLSLFTFSLPVGLAAWALFQALIKPALLEVLPDKIYARLLSEHSGVRLSHLSAWLYASLAILLGALTHIVWDSFTHEDAHSPRILSALEDNVVGPGGFTWPFYRWLQHGSTVIGAIAVVVGLSMWVTHAKRAAQAPTRRLPPHERRFWMALYVLIPLLLVALAPINQLGWQRLHATAALTLLAVAGLRGTVLGLAFSSALISLRLGVLNSGRALRV